MSECLQQVAFISMPGGSEWILILVVGLLIFGRRLPEVARNLGKSVNEFKRGLRDFQDSADEVARDVNKITNEVASQAKDATSDLNDDNAYGDGSYGQGSYGDGSYNDGTYSDGSYENPDEAAPMTEEGGAGHEPAGESQDESTGDVPSKAKDSGAESYGSDAGGADDAAGKVAADAGDPGADASGDDSQVAPMH